MKKVVPKDAVLIPENAKPVFKGVIYDTYQWQQNLYDGTSATFEMLKRPDTVSAICVVDNKLLVLEEEQPHSGVKLSFPGGRVDDTDESTLKAVQREVLEETGYSFKHWHLVAVKQILMKVEWFIFYYLATDVIGIGATKHDAGEKIELEKMAFPKIKQLSLDGVKFVAEAREIFEVTSDINALLKYPEYSGQQVDR